MEEVSLQAVNTDIDHLIFMEYTETMDLGAVVYDRRKSASHNVVMKVMVNLEPASRLEG